MAVDIGALLLFMRCVIPWTSFLSTEGDGKPVARVGLETFKVDNDEVIEL